jgi:hypothetical protein
MAGSSVDDTQVEISCPQCAHITRQPIDWICDHWELACGGCDAGLCLGVSKIASRKGVVRKYLEACCAASKSLFDTDRDAMLRI